MAQFEWVWSAADPDVWDLWQSTDGGVTWNILDSVLGSERTYMLAFASGQFYVQGSDGLGTPETPASNIVIV